jgi:anaerobic glycerol-3-phosphate dehydrogenase
VNNKSNRQLVVELRTKLQEFPHVPPSVIENLDELERRFSMSGEMVTVTNEDGIVVAEVSSDLLSEFFDEVLNDKQPLEVLNQYKSEAANKLLAYLTYRVMEVDPGYVAVS